MVTYIDGTNIIIDWEMPDSNFKPILEFEIVIEDVNADYVSDATNCSGQDPSLTQCSVPMQSMIALTSLTQGSLIVARVRSRNENGWSFFSQENISGAVIEFKPHKIEIVSYDVLNSSNSQVIMLWEELTGVSTGGSEILGYTVQFDQGTGNFIPSAVAVGLAQKTFSGLTGGEQYLFKVAAVNKYGTG